MNSTAVQTVAIVYHSTTGTTASLADAIAEGVLAGGANALSLKIAGDSICAGRFVDEAMLDAVGQVDAIIMGSPTYMGGVSAQFKAFADATGELWSQRAWADKFAAGFTIGSNFSGDQLSTMQYLNTFANQHGMLWVSLDVPGGFEDSIANRLGAQSGLIARAEAGGVHPDDLEMARHLGRRVATLTRKLMRQPSALSHQQHMGTSVVSAPA